MKKIFIILLSALSLTAFAQEKKNIVISSIQCQNTMVASSVRNNLTQAFADSDEWQPIERPSDEQLKKMLDAGEEVGNIPSTKYVLSTEIQDMQSMYFISCRIMDVETTAIVYFATQMSESSPQSIQQACASLANQLLGK